MEQTEPSTASELINHFQTVSAQEGGHMRAMLKDVLAERKSFSPEYNEALTALVTRFGYDARVQNHIMLGLDEIQERKPLQAVRDVTLRLADKACGLKTQFPAGSEQAKGFEAFETRLAVLWRHMMLQDEHTPHAERLKEFKDVRDHSPSLALKAQLPAVKDSVQVCSYLR